MKGWRVVLSRLERNLKPVRWWPGFRDWSMRQQERLAGASAGFGASRPPRSVTPPVNGRIPKCSGNRGQPVCGGAAVGTDARGADPTGEPSQPTTRIPDSPTTLPVNYKSNWPSITWRTLTSASSKCARVMRSSSPERNAWSIPARSSEISERASDTASLGTPSAACVTSVIKRLKCSLWRFRRNELIFDCSFSSYQIDFRTPSNTSVIRNLCSSA